MSRKFAATIITEVEVVDGDDSDQFDRSYLDILTDQLDKAASSLVRDNLLFEAEHQIEVGLEEGGFSVQPFVVNVTRVQLA